MKQTVKDGIFNFTVAAVAAAVGYFCVKGMIRGKEIIDNADSYTQIQQNFNMFKQLVKGVGAVASSWVSMMFTSHLIHNLQGYDDDAIERMM